MKQIKFPIKNFQNCMISSFKDIVLRQRVNKNSCAHIFFSYFKYNFAWEYFHNNIIKPEHFVISNFTLFLPLQSYTKKDWKCKNWFWFFQSDILIKKIFFRYNPITLYIHAEFHQKQDFRQF